MKTQIVKIGNSQGVRIPKALLEQSGLTSEVVLEVAGDSILIRPVRKPREGWEAAFEQMAVEGDDKLLDESLADLPDEAWEW